MCWRLCVAALGCACAVPAQVTTGELVRRAMERNRELTALGARVAEMRGLLRQAGVRPAAALEVESGTGRPLGTQGKEEYAVAYVRPVETGGKREKRVAAARIAVALAEAELDERRRQVVYEVKARAAEAWAERQKTAALERLLRVNGEALRLMAARVAEGDVAPLERRLLAVEQSRAEAQRAAFASRADAALAELRAAAGMAAQEPLDAPDPAAVPVAALSITELLRRAAESRPDLRAARAAEQQGGAETELAEAQARPDLTLSARYAHRNERFEPFGLNAAGTPVPLRDRDNVLTFGFSVPLSGRARNAGNIEAATARAAGARARREHLERLVPLEVEAAWRRWEGASRAAQILAADVLPQSERNLEIMRQAYGLGHLRLLDVLNEQRRMVETELAHIDARAELARARAELERAVGGDLQ